MDCINKDLPAVRRKDCKYTDSRYAFGVCHATGQFWKGRGFITSRESTEPLKSRQLPQKLAVIHQPANTGERTKEEMGKDLADVAAKATPRQPYKTPGLQAVQRSDLVLSAPEKIYLTVPAEEIDSWKRYEATKDSQGRVLQREGRKTFVFYLSNT